VLGLVGNGKGLGRVGWDGDRKRFEGKNWREKHDFVSWDCSLEWQFLYCKWPEYPLKSLKRKWQTRFLFIAWSTTSTSNLTNTITYARHPHIDLTIQNSGEFHFLANFSPKSCYMYGNYALLPPILQKLLLWNLSREKCSLQREKNHGGREPRSIMQKLLSYI